MEGFGGMAIDVLDEVAELESLQGCYEPRRVLQCFTPTSLRRTSTRNWHGATKKDGR